MSSLMQEVMKYLPKGFRFHPTEEELLSHYLRRKTLGLDGPDCAAIPEVDLCGWEPEELRALIESSIVQSKNLEWWFFSEQKPGRTQNRSTRGGYWKKTGQTRDIKSRNGTRQVIGSKKILTFFRGNSSNSTKTDWVMHEYLLARDAFSGVNRKNYVVCMLKCNTDCELEEPMTIDINAILEAEADNGLIPEDLVQARMRSLEPLCRNESVNTNLPPALEQLLHRFNYSADSSRTQFSLGRDSIELDSPFYSSEDLDDNIFETSRPRRQQTVIMENKQTPKVESLHAFVPFNEKKGIIEDDSTQSTASSLGTKTPKARRERELPQIISYAPSEAKGRRHPPSKIKEEIVSAGSSSTSTCKPREVATAIRLEGNTNAANTTKKKEINRMATLTDYKKPAREQKLMISTAKPISRSLSHSSRQCSSIDLSLVCIRNLVLGIILCIPIFRGIFGL